MFKRHFARLQIRLAAWQLRQRQSRLDRLAELRPVSEIDAYLDPSIMKPVSNADRARWIRLIAEAEARRDAAIAQFGPDPLGLGAAPRRGGKNLESC